MVVDDVEIRPVGSYPPTGIDVLVVGTGLAGLTACIECVRKGHKVRVLERDASINTAGNPPLGIFTNLSDIFHRRYVLHGSQCN